MYRVEQAITQVRNLSAPDRRLVPRFLPVRMEIENPVSPRAPRFPSCRSESTGPHIPSHREGCDVRSPECTGPFRWSSTGSFQSGGHISGRL